MPGNGFSADLAAGSLIMVTGASGYIALHAIHELLTLGFRVRGTVRSETKGKRLQTEVFGEEQGYKPDSFEWIVIRDITEKSAFDHTFEGVSGVLHIASPMYRGPNSLDPWNKIVQPARTGTLALLASARAHGPSVKRVVITGSYASIAEEDKQPNEDGLIVYTEDDWNITATERLRTAHDSGETLAPFQAYAASKTWAEEAVWDYVSSNEPAYSISVLLPTLVSGPWLPNSHFSLEKPLDMNRSNIDLWGWLSGKSRVEPEKLDGPGLAVVDVRDTAKAHVLALLNPAAANKRIIISQSLRTYRDLLPTLRSDPELVKKFPNAYWGTPPASTSSKKIRRDASNKRSIELLGISYRPAEETFRDAALWVEKIAKERGWEGISNSDIRDTH